MPRPPYRWMVQSEDRLWNLLQTRYIVHNCFNLLPRFQLYRSVVTHFSHLNARAARVPLVVTVSLRPWLLAVIARFRL